MQDQIRESDTPQPGVLLIDDQPAVLNELAEILQSLNVNVVATTPSSDLVGVLQKHSIAVAVIGIHPQGSEPLAIARLLRGHSPSHHFPILFLVDDSQPASSSADLYAAGAVDYLVRPFLPEVLRCKVVALLEQNRSGYPVLPVDSRAEEFPTTKVFGGVEPPALSAAPDAKSTSASRRRVLVVEDNRDAATSLCVLLELMGHEVRVAYSGPEAVEMAEAWPPEIAISDIGLPGFDGFEVARRLRGQLGSRPLLVALTGYGRDEDRRQSQAAGFDHHLVKPADPNVIERMLLVAR